MRCQGDDVAKEPADERTMKFHFEHIGPIDAADLELGDLTIIAGRNNTGKSYLVHTMYGFLRTWASDWHRPLADNLLRKFGDFLGSEIGGRLSIDRKDIERLRRRTVERAASRFSERSISQIFSSPPSAFADARLSVELAANLPSNSKRLSLSRSGEFRVAAQYGEETVDLELTWRTTGGARRRGTTAGLALNVALPDVPRPFVLSAERFGIALFYKELDFTKSRLVEMLQQIDDRPGPTPLLVVDRIASRYAMPVKDNVDFTRSIENILDQESEFVEEKLHDEIKALMNGYYASADGVIRFKSKARKRRPFHIPLHIASSSARGLSDLYFYLRHVASRNDILFIDGPETHLDTANQVMLARVISHLVKAGLKVLVSTHSDYLIKEINNLVMLNHLRSNGGLKSKVGDYRAEEGISSERIRAYVAKNNTLTRCVVDRYGVDAPVFDETIDRINSVSTELASAVADTE